MLASSERHEQRGHRYPYGATLVPRLWKLGLHHRSQVFVDKSVPEIVEAILKDNGFAPEDYEFKLTSRTYPKREFVLQYQETDIDFVSRLLEHEGIYYFFTQPMERTAPEKVLFADDSPSHENGVGKSTKAMTLVKGPVDAGSAATAIAGGFGAGALGRGLAVGGACVAAAPERPLDHYRRLLDDERDHAGRPEPPEMIERGPREAAPAPAPVSLPDEEAAERARASRGSS